MARRDCQGIKIQGLGKERKRSNLWSKKKDENNKTHLRHHR